MKGERENEKVKVWKRLVVFLSVVFLFMGIFTPARETKAATTYGLTKTSISVYVGKTYTLKTVGVTGTKKWTSSNKSVATVSSSGRVTALKAGKTTITCQVGYYS